jgi:hypothetical protein
MMSWFNASGALSRIILPIVATYIYQYGKDFDLFLSMTCFFIVSFIILIFSYSKLVVITEALP